MKPVEKEITLDQPWFRRPALLLNKTPHIIGSFTPETVTELGALVESIYQGLAAEFEKKGCQVITWNGEPLTEIPPYLVVVNPVFLALSPAAQEALRETESSRFKKAVSERFPEVFPLVVSVGRNQMKLEPPLHPNFVNLICVDDTASVIRSLPSERQVALIRILMAKLGAFRKILVPYQKDEEGHLTFESVILGTLEGGHPHVRSLPDLARRLMVFASAKEVGSWEMVPGLHIPQKAWQESPVARGLISLGKFLGEKGLLSEPIIIRESVKSQRLGDLIVRLVNYSRQAEGAFMAFEPGIAPDLPGLPWTGVSVITCSGRFGAVKTDLTYEDLDAVIPSGEKGLVKVIAVEGITPKGPSVEAEEFIFPLLELIQHTSIRLAPLAGGYREEQNGSLVVPPIRGVIHLHRGFVLPTSDRILVVPTDTTKFPPVGCGVDLMHDMSQDAMMRALHLWEETGRKAICAVFYVPNHGVNTFVFWTPNAQGIIPADPFELFKELISSGELVFTQQVPQM